MSLLAELWLPIVLSGIALFFASFLSWMVLQLHQSDWRKLPAEDEFLRAARAMNLTAGNYMFPGCSNSAEMKSPEHQQKMALGPRGIITVFPMRTWGRAWDEIWG